MTFRKDTCEVCPNCKGAGIEPLSSVKETCQLCEGTGYICKSPDSTVKSTT